MNKFRLSLLAAAALGVVLATPVYAQGYTGVISGEGSQSDETMGGILAPPPADTAPPERGVKDADVPKGYTGLIPGGATDAGPVVDVDVNEADRTARETPATEKKKQVQRSPFAPKRDISSNKVSFGEAPKMSYKPGYTGEFPLTADQLKLLAVLNAKGMDINRLNPETEKRIGFPPGTSKFLNSLKSPRIDGMLPPEFATKATIDSVMKIVEERHGEDRQKAARAAYDRLSVMADGLRTLNSAPTALYVKMGASDSYVKERAETYEKSLDRLHEAMEALDKLRRGD